MTSLPLEQLRAETDASLEKWGESMALPRALLAESRAQHDAIIAELRATRGETEEQANVPLPVERGPEQIVYLRKRPNDFGWSTICTTANAVPFVRKSELDAARAKLDRSERVQKHEDGTHFCSCECVDCYEADLVKERDRADRAEAERDAAKGALAELAALKAERDEAVESQIKSEAAWSAELSEARQQLDKLTFQLATLKAGAEPMGYMLHTEGCRYLSQEQAMDGARVPGWTVLALVPLKPEPAERGDR